jgi:glycosyltransferase involved in cell wall biosynthesis
LERVRAFYGIELPDAAVIPNPAPPADPSRRWTLSGCDPNLVVYVGRFDRHKGGDLAIDAFASIAERYPDLRLAFIGPDRGLQSADGTRVSLDEYVARRVPDESVRSRIQNLGQLTPDEVSEWRQKARVVVVGSRYEVFGMVVVEALVQACPLVAADAGGIPEIVRDGENGLLFPSSDASVLARRLEELLDDPALSERLGKSGSKDIPLRFGIDTVAKQTKDYYQRVLAATR